jgi:cathepsin L
MVSVRVWVLVSTYVYICIVALGLQIGAQAIPWTPSEAEVEEAWRAFVVKYQKMPLGKVDLGIDATTNKVEKAERNDDSFKDKSLSGTYYESAEEAERRFQIFRENYRMIALHNRQRKSPTDLKLGVTPFADLTTEEYRQLIQVRAPVRTNSKESSSSRGKREDSLCKRALPPSVDYKDVIGPINEGSLASSGILVTTESIEDNYLLVHSKRISVSGQELIDCVVSPSGFPIDYFAWIIKNGGIDSEESYPYTGQVGPCKAQPASIIARLAGFIQSQIDNETELACALAFNSPVTVCVDSSHASFQFYSGGIYYEPACSSTMLDHCMLATGYGSIGGKEYWIVENEWGSDWGMDGYVWMARNRNNNCGIATEAVFPIVV